MPVGSLNSKLEKEIYMVVSTVPLTIRKKLRGPGTNGCSNSSPILNSGAVVSRMSFLISSWTWWFLTASYGRTFSVTRRSRWGMMGGYFATLCRNPYTFCRNSFEKLLSSTCFAILRNIFPVYFVLSYFLYQKVAQTKKGDAKNGLKLISPCL